MFWKKITSNKDLIEYESINRRESFRLECEILGPATAAYKGRRARIIDISAGGISFECKNCKEGEIGDLLLELPGKLIENISIPTKIVGITNDITCHCQFTIIDEEATEIIHQYILLRQIAAKRKLRSETKNRGYIK